MLNICLEPEAAAIFCKTVPCKISRDDSAPKLASFQEGDSYILFDAGGIFQSLSTMIRLRLKITVIATL